jgi:hypothetical protein
MPLLDKLVLSVSEVSALLHCSPLINRGASEARRKRTTMNQGLSAQVLTSKPLPLHGACTERSERVEREGVRQASSAKIILFQNATDLQQIFYVKKKK